MDTKATRDVVASYHPDTLIVAVGSTYARPPVAGIEKAMLPDVVLMHPEQTSKTVIVIGGGIVGAETALSLAEHGRAVTLVEMLRHICLDDEPLSQVTLKAQGAAELMNLAAETFYIGDCVKARKIFNGFHEARHAVLSI
jgi:pyruvate/2-oxoglutarate dehydrogenase complex dihydrolipoamide dehydrogenase (E3) component